MSDARWRRIEELCHEALEQPAEVRAEFVRAACDADESMRVEVESLLVNATAAKESGFGIINVGLDLIGQQIGVYQIVAVLGAGGMGEVYRAHDMKLGRDVAIKILPPVFTSDPERLARFEREARVLAALNHPHIGAIYGLEEDAGVRALVLELVEGETLAHRVRLGSVPLSEALSIARQIADALDTAHGKGVVHRDLKPANIKITPGGVVKVLDFGLAKAACGDALGTDVSLGPNVTADGTRQGRILGTPAYMSPEQARGQPVDKRTDIWAFGCVVYEMLTGRAAFDGETLSDTIAVILEREPDWDALPEAIPAPIRRLLQRCLRKDPRQRLHDIADARIEIEEVFGFAAAFDDVKTVSESRRPAARGSWRLLWIVGLPLAGVGLGFLASRIVDRPDGSTTERTVRFLVVPPDNGQSFGFHSISPDGERLAFVTAAPDGSGRLWVRSLDSTSAEPLAPASLTATPFWSPDSRSIAFFQGGKLLKIDLRGGPPQTITDAPGAYAQGDWSPAGVILFHTGLRRALYEVSETGSAAKPVLPLDPSRQETSHSSPQFLPDGRHFLYFVQSGRTEHRGIYIGSLGSKETRRLLNTDRNAVYVGPPTGSGHLLFMRGTTLLAQPFDSRQFLLTGEPSLVGEGIASLQLADIAPGAFSASGSGVLAYRQGANAGTGELVWLDRQGRRVGAVSEPAEYLNPALSPDETRLAVSRINPQSGTSDVWLFDLTRGTPSKFTFDPGDEINPTWSPDGNWIAFSSTSKGPYDIYWKPASSSAEAEPLLESTENKLATDWSPGRVLLFSSGGGHWALPLHGDRKPTGPLPIGASPEISPNGRWVAYQSSESGHPEVYVQSFPPAGGKWQVAEGVEPHWRGDGKELFYIAGGKLIAVTVETDGQVFQSGTHQALFDVRVVSQAHRSSYQVAANGQRFLVNTPMEGASASPITVVTNWTAGLKR